MRDYLRRDLRRHLGDRLLARGHQPDVPTRIFQGVQQPVCIVSRRASRQGTKKETLFHPHEGGDKTGFNEEHVQIAAAALLGQERPTVSIKDDKGAVVTPTEYGVPFVRPAVDHSGQPPDQPAQPDAVEWHSRASRFT
jgi:hypothetical protein